MDIVCPYHLFQRVKNEIEAYGGNTESVDYSAEVAVCALFPEQSVASFEEKLQNMTAGSITGKITGERYIALPVK